MGKKLTDDHVFAVATSHLAQLTVFLQGRKTVLLPDPVHLLKNCCLQHPPRAFPLHRVGFSSLSRDLSNKHSLWSNSQGDRNHLVRASCRGSHKEFHHCSRRACSQKSA